MGMLMICICGFLWDSV